MALIAGIAVVAIGVILIYYGGAAIALGVTAIGAFFATLKRR